VSFFTNERSDHSAILDMVWRKAPGMAIGGGGPIRREVRRSSKAKRERIIAEARAIKAAGLPLNYSALGRKHGVRGSAARSLCVSRGIKQ
jgi:hypothetical protein